MTEGSTQAPTTWRTATFAQKMLLIRRLMGELGYTVEETTTQSGITFVGTSATEAQILLENVNVLNIDDALVWLERYYQTFVGLVSAGVAGRIAQYRLLDEQGKRAFRIELGLEEAVTEDTLTGEE